MRVLKDNKASLPAAPNSDKLEQGELAATCSKCLSSFAFRAADPGVQTTNELEYLLDCPVCNQALEIGKHTGIVRQINSTEE
jgi:hypothetical protein